MNSVFGALLVLVLAKFPQFTNDLSTRNTLSFLKIS